METYATTAVGIGGILRQEKEDFKVEEVLVDGSQANIEKVKPNPALSTSSSRGRFLLCILVKRNWDTFIALRKIAKELQIDQSNIQIAGIKDAKAVTAQYVTVENASTEDISKVNIKDIELRPIGYFHQPICTFYLLGNNFTIKIRKVETSQDKIKKILTQTTNEIEEMGGIPNFYGHQRFGTKRAITHLIGRALVTRNLEEAAMLFLAKPSPYEHPESRQARDQLQQDQDFNRALRNFPVQLRFERIMLMHLAKKPNDFTGAFRKLPIKLRLLFVQAWQSFLFNRFLSARIKKGVSLAEAKEGDYVVNVERSGLPMIQTGKIVNEVNLDQINSLIQLRKMKVALPIVGFKQRLSEGVMGELEKQILIEESVEKEGFSVRDMPELGARGELRTTICPIRNLKSTLLNTIAVQDCIQVELEFMLLRGSYATVLLREIMKTNDVIKAGF